MIRLDLKRDPHWLDLGHGVRLHVRPCTTALMMAAREGKYSTALLLIDRGADVNRRNDSGASALDWATRNGDTTLAERLKRAGARG